MENRKVTESLQMLMDLYPTLANGSMTNHLLLAHYNIQMELTLVSLWVERRKVKENISILTARTMKVFSKMTRYGMGQEL